MFQIVIHHLTRLEKLLMHCSFAAKEINTALTEDFDIRGFFGWGKPVDMHHMLFPFVSAPYRTITFDHADDSVQSFVVILNSLQILTSTSSPQKMVSGRFLGTLFAKTLFIPEFFVKINRCSLCYRLFCDYSNSNTTNIPKRSHLSQIFFHF
jgi:hypothetical protein